MYKLFIDGTGKLRSGWRALTFLIAYAILTAILWVMTEYATRYAGIEVARQSGTYFLLYALSSLIPAILIGWLCGKLFEKLPYRALGAAFTGKWLRHLLVGILLGAGTLIFAVLPAFVLGGERFELYSEVEPARVLISLAVSLFVFALAAAFEEALFRGYVLQTFARSGLAWLAIFLTSAFFGIVHLKNPNASLISTVNTVLAGVWFSVAYLKTRDLWFVWGMHLMWNWMQGSVFGIEVSGLTDLSAFPLLREADSGPLWLTGGNYGIEASIACTLAIIVSTAVIHYMPGINADEEMLALTSPTPPVKQSGS
jgi:membrane protease YdiL (CAAX protease family)